MWKQVTKWLPNKVQSGRFRYCLDDDLQSWMKYFETIGKKSQVRKRGRKKALFVQAA